MPPFCGVGTLAEKCMIPRKKDKRQRDMAQPCISRKSRLAHEGPVHPALIGLQDFPAHGAGGISPWGHGPSSSLFPVLSQGILAAGSKRRWSRLIPSSQVIYIGLKKRKNFSDLESNIQAVKLTFMTLTRDKPLVIEGLGTELISWLGSRQATCNPAL